MKFHIVLALAFATVTARDLHFRTIEVPLVENEDRISNGIDAAPGEFYYQVGISFTKATYVSWCGGSIIGNNWVLTSAHCTDGAWLATLYLGATKRLNAEVTYNASKSDILIHSHYENPPIRNDIALIRIPTTCESGTIGIVRIPSNNDLKYLGETVVISGWGRTSDFNSALSNNLQYAVLEVSPGSDCSEAYPSFVENDTRICVATPNRVSACRADSGGPLVLDGKNLQIGILSFGSRFGCAIERPLVFTRVSEYLDWIKLHTKI